MREFNFIDTLLNEVDLVLRTLLPPEKRQSKRASPGQHLAEPLLNSAQKKQIASLMRVNHSGEVCAQALYQGQALTADLTTIKKQMADAANEEIEHLAWCEQRLQELGSHPSIFNAFWYLGSFIIGASAGLVGDKFSLGFVAETELQVSAHLKGHLEKIPLEDEKTRLILEQMYDDESHHADVAKKSGAIELPDIIKQIMSGVSKLMTKTSYYI